MSDRWRIAQINVAKFREPREHPTNADFEAALDEVNALGSAMPSSAAPTSSVPALRVSTIPVS